MQMTKVEYKLEHVFPARVGILYPAPNGFPQNLIRRIRDYKNTYAQSNTKIKEEKMKLKLFTVCLADELRKNFLKQPATGECCNF